MMEARALKFLRARNNAPEVLSITWRPDLYDNLVEEILCITGNARKPLRTQRLQAPLWRFGHI
eukprot:6102132-Amphidinium_carterae.1